MTRLFFIVSCRSRLDGEKAAEDEIRTKEDGEDQQKTGEEGGDNDDKANGHEDKEDGKGDEGDGAQPKGEEGDEDGEGEEGEGPVNDDLEDNYEDKPMGVEVSDVVTYVSVFVAISDLIWSYPVTSSAVVNQSIESSVRYLYSCGIRLNHNHM